MATIFIDNQPYEVRDGLNLLQACLELGLNLPFFCWHPAMGSVGACRQCAVKQFRDENDTRGRIVMACMTPAANNARISLADPDAQAFRASVIEWMMTNHPHDCPVCDEGGECHLQDMTLMTGHDYRRYRGDKRTFKNQDLGPFVNHEMNRCIQCYRCVRFYRDYAGGKDLNAFALHDTVYFGRAQDGTLESEFSGNLVEICPTGVFTDKTQKKHFTRNWDLQTAPSVCVHCAVGCNILPGERYGTLRRIRNRYNGDVNGYFLCDRGRYGYEFVNHGQRIREIRMPGTPMPEDGQESAQQQQGAQLQQQRAQQQQQRALGWLGETLSGAKGKVIGIGSPRASLESNYALRTLVGAENFYQGVPENEQRLTAQIIDILRRGPAKSPSLQEIAKADAVLVLGEDVSNSAPMLALALRQAVRQQPLKQVAKLRIPEWDDYSVRTAMQNAKGPLFIATPGNTRIDDIASAIGGDKGGNGTKIGTTANRKGAATYHAAPQDLARLGFAVAHELDASAPEVEALTDALRDMAKTIAAALKGAERPLVISGMGCGSEAVIQAAASVAWALCQDGKTAGLSYVVPESNSMGLALMGGESLDAAIQKARDGQVDTLIVLENDLSRRASADQVEAIFQAAQHVIVLDHLENATSARAEMVLPAGTFAESSGTLVNHEGRAQRFYQVYVPASNPAAPPASADETLVLESWRWIKMILSTLGRPEAERWGNLDQIDADMAQALPVFQGVVDIAPPAEFRIAGQKIPRQPARWSGRTANTANISVHEPKPPDDPDSPLAYSMEGMEVNPPRQPPAALLPRIWAPGWNSVQALTRLKDEINGPLRGGPTGKRLIDPGSGGGGTGNSSSGGGGAGSSSGGADSSSGANDGGERPVYFAEIPEAFETRPGEWLAVPLFHVFGSEELSMHSAGVAERAPQPYLAIHPEDAALLTGTALPTGEPGSIAEPNPIPLVGEGEMFALTLNGSRYVLPARLRLDLPRGVIGMPVGLAGIPFAALPAWGTLTQVSEAGGAQGGGAQGGGAKGVAR